MQLKPLKQKKAPTHLNGEWVSWRFNVCRQGAPAASTNGCG